MDVVGPLEESLNRFILSIMDYATRYPEAIPLRVAMSQSILEALIPFFCRVGIPEEILMDQGTLFMAQLMQQLCRLLRVTHLRMSVYHPQTDGLVERFNQTIKNTLCKVVCQDGWDWPQVLPIALLMLRSTPEASTGFSLFEVLYGRDQRNLLDIDWETWEESKESEQPLVNYILKLQNRLGSIGRMVEENLKAAQGQQKEAFDRKAHPRTFQVGDLILLLLPSSYNKLLAQLQGPYQITKALSDVTYRVEHPDRKKPSQIYHINLLKAWHSLTATLVGYTSTATPQNMGPYVKQSNPLANLIQTGLTPEQQQDLLHLIRHNQDRFSTQSGRTSLAYHWIHTNPGVVIRRPPYHLPDAIRKAIEAEVQEILQLGVIEPSQSE